MLVMTVLVQFLHPLLVSDSSWVLIMYQIFYISLFVAGIYLVSSSKRSMWLLIAACASWLFVGAVFAFRPDLQWALGSFSGYV